MDDSTVAVVPSQRSVIFTLRAAFVSLLASIALEHPLWVRMIWSGVMVAAFIVQGKREWHKLRKSKETRDRIARVDFLWSEVAAAEEFLAELPETRVIERAGFEHKLREALQELDELGQIDRGR